MKIKFFLVSVLALVLGHAAGCRADDKLILGTADKHWNAASTTVKVGDVVTWQVQQGTHGVMFNNYDDAQKVLSSAPPFRIVAVTGPNAENVPDLAAALKLDPQRDVLCVDPKLEVFQALALIDGVPVYDEKKGRYLFPQSFKADGTIAYDDDVMHGLFIVDASGFLTCCNRGFMADDDTDQTLAEIQFAHDVPAGLGNYQSTLTNARPQTPRDRIILDRERMNLKREELRYQEFKKDGR